MPDNPKMERKVWLLPVELMDRVRAYQSNNGIASEVEVGRRLVGYALDMLDTPSDILGRLQADYAICKDLRAAAQNVLTMHPRVFSIRFGDRCIEFAAGTPDCLVKMKG